MHGRFSKNGSERGAALLLFTLMLATVILPLIGLSIDGGIAYFAQQRLNAAVDAAALAGGRSLNVGQTAAEQTTNVRKVATQYFYANFPNGILNSNSVSLTIPEPAVTSSHEITVQVSASGTVPLYFLGLLGHPTVNIAASAQTSRRDANVVLALDRSGSMSRVCQTMATDANNFVSMFVEGRDTVGLITFMGNASVDAPASKTFKTAIRNQLATLQCGGNTGSAEALALAHQQIKKIAEPGAFNVIVFFTDGMPNGYTAGPPAANQPAGFPVNAGQACNGGKPVAGYLSDSGGVYDATAQPINSTATPFVTAQGCSSTRYSVLAKVFAFIPPADFYGNSARAANYAPVTLDANGAIEMTAANSDAVSTNAAVEAARSIRQDNVTVYSMGLDGDGGVDNKLLELIANDPGYPATYNAAEPAGKYYYSPNAGQLGAAFQSIASEILRISQ